MTTTDSTKIRVRDHAPATRQMRAEVLAGLTATPKYFPSHYLYDERGLTLFNQICETDDYYVTRCELEILRTSGAAIAQTLGPAPLVIAPGSGAGIKPRLLLEALDAPAGYVPIDISCEHLQASAVELKRDYPALQVLPVCADFTTDFDLPPSVAAADHRVVYFPGSTVGNFEPDAAVALLRRFATLSTRDGGVLLGVDLKKDPAILLPAYDDAEGASAAFALNILTRLNQELDADFDPDAFEYSATYEANGGRIEMALVSRADQTVTIDDREIALAADERIRTEWSYKYSRAEFAALASAAGLEVVDYWQDARGLFSMQYLHRTD